jgi:hypothetical protein
MAATRKQKGGVQLARRRRPTKKRARRTQIRVDAPSRNSRSGHSVASARNECASLYSALDYIPEMPNITTENMGKRLARVQARIDELGCGNSGRTD